MHAGVYVEPGPDRDALTEALAKESYIPVYLDPKTVRVKSVCFIAAEVWQYHWACMASLT